MNHLLFPYPKSLFEAKEILCQAEILLIKCNKKSPEFKIKEQEILNNIQELYTMACQQHESYLQYLFQKWLRGKGIRLRRINV